MIIVRLMGGMGNQLFQYALGRRLSLLTGEPLKLDAGDWRPGSSRCRLDRFRIAADLASPQEVERLTGIHRGRGFVARAHRRISRRLISLFPAPSMKVVTERSCRFDPTVLDSQGNVYLDGYWQSEKYFKDVEQTIRSELTLSQPPDRDNQELLAGILSGESVSIHVRRGDYVSDPHIASVIGSCPPDYYAAAIDAVLPDVGNPEFYVFSDDIGWCRTHLPTNHPTSFVEHNGPERDWEDFRLMSACRHHVIANSSFSWWASWLCPHPDKVVVAPERWFADPGRDSSDIVPESWQRI